MKTTDNSIHKTSTKKIFRCYDATGHPTSYEDYKDIFRPYLHLLQVGQQLRHGETGTILKRLK